MTSSILNALKSIGPPGSLGFLVFCIGAGVCAARVWPRRGLVTRAWAAVVILGYTLLSIPVVADAIAGGLPPIDGAADTASAGPLDLLVVLSGDSFKGRVSETARIYRTMSPRHVLVLGEPWFVRRLEAAGIPRAAMRQDDVARTTRAQMARVAAFAPSHGRVVLVASRLQMPRVALLAGQGGLHLRLWPSPTDPEPARLGFRRFLPAPRVSSIAGDAMYERLAVAFYRYRGWIPARSWKDPGLPPR